MSMHQYIGARYVPYYYENSLDPTSTEWEPNVNYEALTVVTLPNLHSYISKKRVPDTVGSPALNPEYWLDTGSDNAYIAQLQQDLGDVATLNTTDKTSAVNAINEVLSDVGDLTSLLTTDKDSAVNAINEVYSIVDKLDENSLYGKQIAVYADSYGNIANPFAVKWINALSNFSGKAVHNVSASGAKMSAIVSNFDNYVADVYIIVGGINDWLQGTSLQTFRTNISSMCTAIRNANPNAQIMFFTMLPDLVSTASGILYPVEYYRQIIWQTSQVYHFMVSSGLKAQNVVLADGLHPSEATATAISNAIIRAYASGGDSRDYHSEFWRHESNKILLGITNGQPWVTLQLGWVAFTNGAYSQTLSYLNQGICLTNISRTGITIPSDNHLYSYKITLDNNGLYIIAARTSDDFRFTGSLNIVEFEIPLNFRGMIESGN